MFAKAGFRWVLISMACCLSLLFLFSDVGLALEGSLKAIPVSTNSTAGEKIYLPVLMYHDFSNDPQKFSSITVSAPKFENDLRALQEAGYTSMLPCEFLEAFKSGNLPEKPIIITIDDGYLSNYQLAFPVLQKLGMKATIFVVGGTVGRETNINNTCYIIPHFGIAEAQIMVESGLVSIQPHSYNLHIGEDSSRNLVKGMSRFPGENDDDYKQRLLNDTITIKKTIEEEMGDKVVSYSYPYGYHSKIADQVLKDLGVEMTFTVDKGVNRISGHNFYHLKRINVDSKFSYPKLIRYLEEQRKR